ncbi:alpha/beta hydrolase [Limnoglobus roseus]|uniref:Alpha/beta hydrolase n=2 Tax=Limnoglobus roseus TaxID=2598579 RepID=A0A5C1A4S7_9BACT|nr:alpha/beta hydrolase [Limnoglobus roseus]
MFRTLLLALLMLVLCGAAGAADPKPFPGAVTKWRGFERHDFKQAGTDAIVVVPAKALPGRPWVWRGEFFDAFADADAALVKAGWHLAYLKVPDLFGSPKALKKWESFHAAMVQDYGLHPKPGFIGLSRGGLYCMNWAAAHPDKTLAVYLDNAVCDFKSWPGGVVKKLGTGQGSAAEWKKMLAAYDFKTDDEALAYKLNPVDNLAPLAGAKVPLLLVYADKDSAVPHAENSALVYDRYKALGGPVERVVKVGFDHHPHGLTDVTPVVTFFTNALSGGGEIVREEIEWLDVWVPGNSNRDLPKVLLIGDSIARGYFKDVEEKLKGKAVVCRLSTSKSLGDPGLIAEVKLVLGQTQFDVVHFNNGLHGWGYTEDQYAAALPELIATIRAGAPRAKLVWATTTAVRVADKVDTISEKTDRVKKRNELAASVMAKEKIGTDDLFAVVAEKPEFFSRDGVHFNAKGNAALGAQVADAIRRLLAAAGANQ